MDKANFIKPTACLACCLLLVLLMPGCGSTDKVDDESYRTIKANPLRDTDAAREANEQGLEHLDAGEIEQAELAFKKALKADKEFGPAHNNLGKVYYLKKNWYFAAHEFDNAIRLMPNHAGPYNNLGLTLIGSGEPGKIDDAIEHFRKATTLDPLNIEYQANLAQTLLNRGEKTAEVITLLRSVAARDERVEWRRWASHRLAAMGLE